MVELEAVQALAVPRTPEERVLVEEQQKLATEEEVDRFEQQAVEEQLMALELEEAEADSREQVREVRQMLLVLEVLEVLEQLRRVLAEEVEAEMLEQRVPLILLEEVEAGRPKVLAAEGQEAGTLLQQVLLKLVEVEQRTPDTVAAVAVAVKEQPRPLVVGTQVQQTLAEGLVEVAGTSELQVAVVQR